MGLNGEFTADLNSSIENWGLRANHKNDRSSSFPFIHRFTKNNNGKDNVINIQSLDQEKNIGSSGGQNGEPHVSTPTTRNLSQTFVLRKEHNDASSRHNKFDEMSVTFSDVDEEVVLSPIKLSNTSTENSVSHVNANINDLHQKCLSNSTNNVAKPASGIKIRRSALGRFLEPLKFRSNKKSARDSIVTPIHQPLNINNQTNSANTRSIFGRRKARSLGDSSELSGMINILPNAPTSKNGLPIEVEDLRKLPRHSHSSNLTNLDDSSHTHFSNSLELSFLTKEDKANMKKAIVKESLQTAKANETGSVIATEDLECWMSKLPQSLQEAPLNELLIPGSHDAFSYSLESGEIAPDSPGIVGGLAKAAPCITKPALIRWSVTQNSQAHIQLRHGVRYFDIRVAVKNSRFHFVHGLYGADLEPILEQIRDFLSSRKGEVVFLDFQHLYNMMEEDHNLFIDLITTTFDGLICPQKYDMSKITLNYLAKNNYQVLVFYRHAMGRKYRNLWPSVALPNPWPQQTKIKEMLKFIKTAISRRPIDAFFVTQCVLTPSYGYLVKNIGSTLEKKMAYPCNRAVVDWLKNISVGIKGPNIVMTDFVDHDNWAVPRTTIQRNQELLNS